MCKPNRTVARIMQGAPRDPRIVAAQQRRWEEDPMRVDMEAFQAGKMTMDEFRAKWDPSFTKQPA